MLSDFDITVLEIRAANRLRNSPVDVATRHPDRSRWAVALKREGRTYYTVCGRDVLCDSLHPVILPKGCSYSWRCTEPGECLIIEFDAPQTRDDIFSFTLPDNAFFIDSFLDIQKNLHVSTPEARLLCRSKLYSLLLLLIQTASKAYVPKAKQLRLQPAVEHITENYFDPSITNDVLAQKCGMSTVYFRKCFEAVYSLSPIRYLHDFRIQRAKDLLASDYGSISQVAESVGYSSVYHFSKMFKSYTGLSPSQYAKSAHP